MSRGSEGSTNDPSVFDNDAPVEERTEPASDTNRVTSYSASGEDDEPNSFDLKAPPPPRALSNVETLSERLFSVGHLKFILRDATLHSRFRNFLQKYRPDAARTLSRHIETRKAILAVDYANAIAGDLTGEIAGAAILDETFDQHAGNQLDELVSDGLSAYVTHLLVQVATETLVKEITGHNMPLLRELVYGLAEVYCLTDPSLPDNPIVYASEGDEEFYRCTQYGRDYVLGRNCRFLQGPRSSRSSAARLLKACTEGHEVCETILNYRRDGSPFLNLLMIAPLFDNRGAIRYFIGAQIDVTGLIEEGRGIDSFARLLSQDVENARHDKKPTLADPKPIGKTPEAALAELSELMSENDVEVVTRHARRTNPTSQARSDSMSSGSSSRQRSGTERRYLGLEDPLIDQLWPSQHLGSSGRLPGVFQNYLLVRPYPSLRITFTSPTLRIPGLLQSKFMDRIGGPAHVRDGVLSALESSVGVTARVEWLSSSSQPSQHTAQWSYANDRPDSASAAGYSPTATPSPNQQGKPRWLHCTPLFGSDGKVGVWMVVMVERETISGGLNVAEKTAASYYSQGSGQGPGSRYTSGKLYKDYLRREGRVDSIAESSYPQGQVSAQPPTRANAAHGLQRPGSQRGPRGGPYPTSSTKTTLSQSALGQSSLKSHPAGHGGSQKSTRSAALTTPTSIATANTDYATRDRGRGRQSDESTRHREAGALQYPPNPQSMPHQQPHSSQLKQQQPQTLSAQEREEAAQRARVLAERAMAGEEGFRDF